MVSSCCAWADRIGSAIVISSGAVYADARAGLSVRAGLPGAIPEEQPLLAPGDETYSTRKVGLEQVLLDAGTLPVTLLRAGHPRPAPARTRASGTFVKRALDKRPVRVLAYRGLSRFHTISTVNLAS